jgi:L-2-hydroxyglutarate oxidase
VPNLAVVRFDFAVVGGGIVGAASARALLQGGGSLALLEKEDSLARHQSGRNSGVIHSGIYYEPGSLKARLCVEGRKMLLEYCREGGIPHEVRGKLIVAARREELPRLATLEERARANGLAGVRRLGPEELREIEPHASGRAALHVPQTGVVEYARVAEALGGDIVRAGGEIRTRAGLRGVRREPGGLRLETAAGEVSCRVLVNCAGLQADRVARLCGARPNVHILPFRGEYVKLVAARRHLVRSLIYPVPDPRFPFLGVHFTRRVTGEVEAGPNAVLALCREGYRRGSFRARDAAEILAFPGLWRFAAGHARTGLAELLRSKSLHAMTAALARLVPEVSAEDLRPAGAGVRAQAMDRGGRLLDDFHFAQDDRALHVLNAPSPAATASLRIGEVIAERARALRGRG